MEKNQKLQDEIRNEFKTEQSKYVYFLLAASGSAVALALNWTKENTLTYSLIPVGLAVLSWGFSFYSGCMFMKIRLSILHKNNRYFEVLKGNDPDIGSDAATIKFAEPKIKKILEDDVDRASIWFLRQFRWLIIGAVLFVCWHIVELYLNTKP